MLIELASRAAELYSRQDLMEKRLLLRFLCSNCAVTDGKLAVEYRKPFDLLAVTKKAELKARPDEAPEKGELANWRPLVYSLRKECVVPSSQFLGTVEVAKVILNELPQFRVGRG